MCINARKINGSIWRFSADNYGKNLDRTSFFLLFFYLFFVFNKHESETHKIVIFQLENCQPIWLTVYLYIKRYILCCSDYRLNCQQALCFSFIIGWAIIYLLQYQNKKKKQKNVNRVGLKPGYTSCGNYYLLISLKLRQKKNMLNNNRQ